MRQVVVSIALAFALGCATAPAQDVYYLLRATPDPPPPPADPDALVGMSRVSIASYLDRSGLVVGAAERRIEEARHHHWAEPLDEAISRFLEARISAALGRALSTDFERQPWWRWRIGVRIDELHGSESGEVRLVARWSIVDLQDRTATRDHSFARTTQQAQPGFDALVEAEIELLEQLAQAIAQSAPSP